MTGKANRARSNAQSLFNDGFCSIHIFSDVSLLQV